MSDPGTILYLREEDVRQTISMSDALTLAEKGVRAGAAGQVAGNNFSMAGWVTALKTSNSD